MEENIITTTTTMSQRNADLSKVDNEKGLIEHHDDNDDPSHEEEEEDGSETFAFVEPQEDDYYYGDDDMAFRSPPSPKPMTRKTSTMTTVTTMSTMTSTSCLYDEYDHDDDHDDDRFEVCAPLKGLLTDNVFLKSLPSVDAQPEKNQIESGIALASEIIPLGPATSTTSPTPYGSMGGNDYHYQQYQHRYGLGCLTKSDSQLAQQQVEADHERPMYISVHFYKERRDARVGIRFKSMNGQLYISNLSTWEGTLLESCPLRCNDKVVSLNGNTACQRWTPAHAMRFIRSREGHMSILVANPSGDPNSTLSTIYKHSGDNKLGIYFQKDANKKIRVLDVSRDRPFGCRSIIQAGDFVHSINDVRCTKATTCQAVVDMIRSSERSVTIRTLDLDVEDVTSRWLSALSSHTVSTVTDSSDSDSDRRDDEDGENDDEIVPEATDVAFVDINEGHIANGTDIHPDKYFSINKEPHTEKDGKTIEPSLISIVINKPTYDTKLGLVLTSADVDDTVLQGGYVRDTVLAVGRLHENGLLSSSPLKEGYHLLSINHENCSRWSPGKAHRVIAGTIGPIHLVACNPKGDPNYVQAMAYKSSPRSKVGLRVKKAEGRPLRVSDIQTDGLFTNSVLNIDDEIVRINEYSAAALRPVVAVDVVKRAVESVCILAKVEGCFAIILAQDSNNHQKSRSKGGRHGRMKKFSSLYSNKHKNKKDKKKNKSRWLRLFRR